MASALLFSGALLNCFVWRPGHRGYISFHWLNHHLSFAKVIRTHAGSTYL